MKKGRIVTIIAFAIYLLLLVWVVIFKTQIGLISFSIHGWRAPINLIPFGQPLMSNGRIDLSDMIYIVIAFIPLGLFISMLRSPKKGWIAVLIGFLLSVLFETVQYVFRIGSADITDVIMNTAGTAIGVLLFMLLRRLLKDRTEKVLSIVILTLELIFIFGYGAILVMN